MRHLYKEKKMNKIRILIFLLLLSTNPIMAGAESIVTDNFNSYNNGSVVNQGNWDSYANGYNFIVQENITTEGPKALYVDQQGDNIIVKPGRSLSDGKQTFYIKTKNRNNWAEYSRVSVRVSNGIWGRSESLASVDLQWDGRVCYSRNVQSINFETYNDNEWTKISIEWRSIDQKVRYSVNDRNWTNWDLSYNGFTEFNYVGIEFSLLGGSGGAYFDALDTDSARIPIKINPVSTNSVNLCWPSPAYGFILQSATMLAPTNWVTTEDIPTWTNAMWNTTVTTTNQVMFFRLIKP